VAAASATAGGDVIEGKCHGHTTHSSPHPIPGRTNPTPKNPGIANLQTFFRFFSVTYSPTPEIPPRPYAFLKPESVVSPSSRSPATAHSATKIPAKRKNERETTAMSSTPAQIAANIANAQASTGPRTIAGKAACSKNATTHGLSTTRDFIRPGEENLYQQNRADLLDQLAPIGILECNLADEIHRAMWRLRRCGEVEAGLVNTCTSAASTNDPMQDETAARTQNSVDRARAQAHRLLHKCTAELRKLQTERHFRNEYFEAGTNLSPLGICDFTQVRKGVDQQVSASLRQHKLDEINELAAAFEDNRQHVATHIAPITIQTQTPRNAPCPCGSNQKYKRCCGKNAPAILHAA